MLTEQTWPVQQAPIAGQGLRFVFSGGLVALVYIATTSLLAEGVGLTFELALAIGFTIAVVTHFALQRLFVWKQSEGYALPFGHQVVRYLLLAGMQYGVTAAATVILPQALGISTEVVYLMCAALLSTVNFLVFRSRVFHPEPHRPTT